MKKTIRLSETDLHRVIKEAVTRVLNEGQGWNFFKHNAVKAFKRGMSGEDFTGGDPDWKGEVSRYISTGNPKDNETEREKRMPWRRTYDETGLFDDSHRPENNDNIIDTSFSGKLGRATGVASTAAMLGLGLGLGKVVNATKKAGRGIKRAVGDVAKSIERRRLKRATSGDPNVPYM